MRILLAEDDPLLGDGLRAGLRQLGFLVDWVRDGEAAERELRAQPYAAAVLDLGLPLKDGMEVLASDPPRRHHAAGAGADRARCRAATASAASTSAPTTTCVKPVDLNELAARLRALVRRAHGQPQECLAAQDVIARPGRAHRDAGRACR